MKAGKRHGVGRLTSPGMKCPPSPDIVYEGILFTSGYPFVVISFLGRRLEG
jgi:hypothetical protein